MNRKMLVTGVPGWLGGSFLRALCGLNPELSSLALAGPGDEVRCLCLDPASRGPLEAIHPSISAIPGNLCDAPSLRGLFENSEGAVLFHLASVVHPDRGVGEFTRVNVEGTRNLLDLAVAAGVARLILISSNSVAGSNPSREHLFTEGTPPHPYMGYGRSKAAMESLAGELSRSGKVETVILRPAWFYGPGQPERQSLFFSMIRKGRVPMLGDGGNKRSLSYVDDVSQAMLLAARSREAVGNTYWIADERPYSMNEIIDTIATVMDEDFGLPVVRRTIRLPALAGVAATAADWVLQRAGVYVQKMHVLSEMHRTIACSVEKAERELGFRPRVGLREGMRRSVQWCIDHGVRL